MPNMESLDSSSLKTHSINCADEIGKNKSDIISSMPKIHNHTPARILFHAGNAKSDRLPGYFKNNLTQNP